MTNRDFRDTPEKNDDVIISTDILYLRHKKRNGIIFDDRHIFDNPPGG
jgi:hypothetical protein